MELPTTIFFEMFLWIWNHPLFLHSDDIIRLLEQNGQLLNKSAILFLTISLDLMKSLEVRIAGDQSESLLQNAVQVFHIAHFLHFNPP